MTGLLKTKARIGQIAYTNCLPFYHNLFRGNEDNFEFYKDVPEKINRAMSRGAVDIAPISSLEYLNHQDQYILLPGLAIGARDFSGSVLIFSREKIEDLNRQTIAVSQDSLSSVALLKIILKFKYKFENEFVSCPSDPDEMLEKHTAALVIGDDALFHKPSEFVYKYDLSELWWSWAEKPFCFALWAARREFAERYPKEVGLFYEHLHENVSRNLMDIETLVRDALGMDFMNEDFPKVFGYLFNLNYGLDEEMVDGLELYFRLATRLGFSPKAKPLEFIKLP